jgi:deazaflavin-dependent oxidoreductase (nitroreductase family)
LNAVPADQTAPIPYPSGTLRDVLRAPLLMYRLGLGHLLNALHIMVLVTRGRKSGLPRYTPIEYRRHGSKIYIVSAWGRRTNWLQNLLDNPNVTVQLGQRTQAARARLVTDPAEALRALYQFRRTAPGRYDALLSYLIDSTVNSRTLPALSGQFTIARLDLTDETPPLPGVPQDLTGLLPLALVAGLGITAVLVFPRRRKV